MSHPCQTQAEWLANEVAIYQAEGWTDACVEWPTGLSRSRGGYGATAHEGRVVRVPRLAWYFAHSEWPTQTIDHICRNPPCFNITHLRDISNELNASLAIQQPKTHCPSGHEYTPENTYVRTDGYTECRTCRRAR